MVQRRSPHLPRRSPRRALTRVMAACSITLGTLAVAAPSWAGPMMGC